MIQLRKQSNIVIINRITQEEVRQRLKLKNPVFLSEVGLVVTTLIWGLAFVVVKNTTACVPTNYIIAIRFGIAAVLMLVLFFPKIRKIDLYSIRSGAILSVILYTSYFFQTYGVQFTTAGNNAFLTAVYVVFVPFLYWIVQKVKPSVNNIISAFICITGVGLLSLHPGHSVNIGDMFSLLSGLTFGLHIVIIGILSEKSDPILLSFTQFFFTALISLAVASGTEQFPAKLETPTILSLLYVSVFSTMLAMVLQTACQKYIPPSRASLIMSMESLFGTMFGIIFLGEPLTIKIFLGFLLIFAAILLSETKFSFLKLNFIHTIKQRAAALKKEES